jgi:uncharacterized protein (TIGR03086 family)
MDHHQALDRAGDGFLDHLRAVTDDQWDAPTLCGDWSVHDLAHHLLAGSMMAVRLAEGGSREDATAAFELTLDDTDPVGAVEAAFAAEAVAMSDPAVLAATLPHPAADLPGSQILGFRVADRLVHTWDLATALDAEPTLDEDAAGVVWDDLQPMLPMLGDLGIFGDGPSGTVPDDADLSLKVLDALGRRP